MGKEKADEMKNFFESMSTQIRKMVVVPDKTPEDENDSEPDESDEQEEEEDGP